MHLYCKHVVLSSKDFQETWLWIAFCGLRENVNNLEVSNDDNATEINKKNTSALRPFFHKQVVDTEL